MNVSPEVNATPQKGSTAEVMLAQFCSPTGRTGWRYNNSGEAVPALPMKQLQKHTNATTGVSMVASSQHRRSPPGPQTPASRMSGYDIVPRSGPWTDGSSRSTIYTPGTTPGSARRLNEVDISGCAQSVDIERITGGRDVRTTIMLRNIPNNITYHQLKGIVDVTGRGKYDFSYLRIDFGKNTNVGYAFVNFIDPRYIVDFVRRWVGREWIPGLRFGKARRPRIADVSYATVQGIDCLIEKFRNSSVLDEFADFRPKLWYTVKTATDASLIGTEREVPSSEQPVQEAAEPR